MDFLGILSETFARSGFANAHRFWYDAGQPA